MNSKEKKIVAVDVSKDSLATYWEEIGKAKNYDNHKTGISKLVQQLKKIKPTLVVLESTGGYEHALCEALWEEGIPLTKVNPGRVKHFRAAIGYSAKTDPIDAKAIYEFGMSLDLKPQEAPSKEITEVKQLFLRRQQLSQITVAEQNHLKAPTADKAAKLSIKRTIRFLQKEMKALGKDIATKLELIPEIKTKLKVLQKEKGVGPVLLSAILTLLPELGTLNRGTVASLVGVAPFCNDSGEATKKRIIKGGRHTLRTVLYMATLSVIRNNGTIKAFYRGLLERGKLKKVAITACMRKFLIRLNTLAREALLSDPASAEQGA